MAWKKVTLSGDIVNADINGSAAIAYSKLNLTNSIDSADYVDGSIDLVHITTGTDGELITWDASGDPARVAVGTNDHVLTSNGAGAAPTFQAAGSAATRASLSIDTDDSPQFAGLNVGSAGDTTLTGSSGVLSVEGKAVYVQGSTDVAVLDGGTGSSTAPMIGLVTAANASAARTVLGVSAANADSTGNSATATVAAKVTIADNESTNESNALIFTSGGDIDGGNIALESDGTCTYNPSTGKITATGFVGALTGNASGSSASCSGLAATATALASARTIGGTSFDGTANIAVGLAGTATILATARTIGGVSFNGSANISLVSSSIPDNAADTTGEAGTVATIAGLAPNTATTQATQGAITSAAALATVGTITAGAWRGDTVDAAYGGTGTTSITNLKNLLDDETWTFANKVTLTGDLDVKGTTTTINSANTSFTDTSIQLNVADGESAFGDSASAIVFGDSTGATSTGRIINVGTAAGGFKFMTGNATNTPTGNNNVSDGGTYADCRMNGLVLNTQSEPTTEVEGMLYWNGSNLYIGNPS
jgi:hypothetical protein